MTTIDEWVKAADYIEKTTKEVFCREDTATKKFVKAISEFKL